MLDEIQAGGVSKGSMPVDKENDDETVNDMIGCDSQRSQYRLEYEAEELSSENSVSTRCSTWVSA